MLPHPAQQIAFQFHNTYLGSTNQCNYYKIACINMLWQHDFQMKSKNFAVQYPHWQQSIKVTIPGTLCISLSPSRFSLLSHQQAESRVSWLTLQRQSIVQSPNTLKKWSCNGIPTKTDRIQVLCLLDVNMFLQNSMPTRFWHTSIIVFLSIQSSIMCKKFIKLKIAFR